MTTHYALEVRPYLDRDGEALIEYVMAHAHAPPRGARSGATRVLLQV